MAADCCFPTRLRGAPESFKRAAQVRRSGLRGLRSSLSRDGLECLSDGSNPNGMDNLAKNPNAPPK